MRIRQQALGRRVVVLVVLGLLAAGAYLIFFESPVQAAGNTRHTEKATSGVSATTFAAVVVALIVVMLSDTFSGSVDMASAGARYIYDKALNTLHNPANDYPEDQREGLEAAKKLHVGGLYNEGNTCFMNTVVQSFASLQHLKDVLNKNIKVQGSEMSIVLSRLIEKLNEKTAKKHTYSTNELIKSLGKESRYSGYDQEDAQEFFQALLHELEKDVKKRVNIEKRPDAIVTPFDGTSAMRVGCLKCGEMEGIRRGVISSLDLGLSNFSRAKKDFIKLEELISEYCSMETISGVECYRCSLLKFREELQMKLSAAGSQLEALFQARLDEVDQALKEKVIDEKKYSVLKPPSHKEQCDKSKQIMLALPTADIIMIHINRSVFNMYTGATTKNYTPVKFPLILDTSDYVIDTTSDINNDPSIPMRPIPEPGLSGMSYSLKAVVVHFGSHNFGHYVCYRKCEEGYWWRISDHSVELAYEHQVLNAQGVFMLFYEKNRVRSKPDDEKEKDVAHEEHGHEGTDITDMNTTKSTL